MFDFEKPSVIWLGDPNTITKEYLTIADILTVNSGTSATNGSVSITLGNAVSGEVYTTNAILFNSPSIYSVPLPSGTINSDQTFTAQSTSQQGAQAVCWVRNDQWIILNIRDTRAQSNPGNIQAGEIAIQALGAAGRVILKQDNSINLYTLSGGNSMGVFITPAQNSIETINAKGYGLSIAADSVSLSASTSSPQGGILTINDSGNVNLTGTKQTQIDGGNIVLGSMVEPGINTLVINPNAIISTLTDITTAMTAIMAAISSFTGTGTFPSAAAAVTAIEAVQATISGLSEFISSQKCSAQ